MSDFFDFDPDGDEVIDRQVIAHDDPATDRSVARRSALQALYEIDTARHPLGEVLANCLANTENRRSVRNYITLLVKGVIAHRRKLDSILQQYAPDWPIDQVAVVDRNILRIAVYELGVDTRIPVGVAIDEAIELAKLFGAENTPRFVNGVLGTVADDLESVRSYLSDQPRSANEEELEPDTELPE